MKYFYKGVEINKRSEVDFVDHIVLLKDGNEEVLLMSDMCGLCFPTLLLLVINYFESRQFYESAKKLRLIDSKYQKLLEKKPFEKNKLKKYRDNINEIITKKVKIIDIWTHGGDGGKGSELFLRTHSLRCFPISCFELEAKVAFKNLVN